MSSTARHDLCEFAEWERVCGVGLGVLGFDVDGDGADGVRVEAAAMKKGLELGFEVSVDWGEGI